MIQVISSLYEQDYYLWLEEQVHSLESLALDKLDVANLIIEIQGMGKAEKLAKTSNLRILLMHLLKWIYQDKKRTNSCQYTIREHRKRILKTLKQSPSLKNYYQEILAEAYQDARELAADETGLPITIFPVECEFTTEQILDPEFLTNHRQ
ncbi:MAG: DUF29 domain-containing protein [Gloeocapsa sp. DLM2.Bin57]|nr:MAG: DUF29 domain-containing protein [Gloeocapsa sp. DLM2.Bin57]